MKNAYWGFSVWVIPGREPTIPRTIKADARCGAGPSPQKGPTYASPFDECRLPTTRERVESLIRICRVDDHPTDASSRAPWSFPPPSMMAACTIWRTESRKRFVAMFITTPGIGAACS